MTNFMRTIYRLFSLETTSVDTLFYFWLEQSVSSTRYLLFSVLVHAFLLGGLLFMQKPEAPQSNIEVVFTGPVKNSNQTKTPVARSQTSKSKAKIMDFGLSTTKAVKDSFSSNQNMDPNQALAEMEGSPDIFDPYGGLEMPEIRFVQSLWREIDKAIVNPPYLSEYGHFGKVYFVFDVSAEGQLVEESIRVKAESRVLKVIAARAIRKAVLNINGELPKPRKLTKIFSTFSWTDYQTCTHLRGTGKNTLSFCNYAEDKRKRFTAGEKVATYLGALKYGFDAVDEIKKYNREEMRRNTQFNPFGEFERDPDWNLGT